MSFLRLFLGDLHMSTIVGEPGLEGQRIRQADRMG